MKLEDFKKEELIYALNACQPLFDPLTVLKKYRLSSFAQELDKISKYREYVLAAMDIALKERDNKRFWELNTELDALETQYDQVEGERNKYI